MKRTPALVSAAAALGLVAGLALQARASALTGEVSPFLVEVAWLTPAASPVQMEGPDARWAPPAPGALATPSASAEDAGGRAARPDVDPREVVRRVGCPRGQAEQAVPDLRRS
ncbi:MAG: hypothetical protein KY467_01825 [Gemmatimonadetes bacterium]|nr:hypothetical protein [Gemmatimonadota bacterium]